MPDSTAHLATDARAIFDAAVHRVQAPALMARFEHEAMLGQPLVAFRRVIVLGAGKASLAMAASLEAAYPSMAFEGAVTVPHGYPETLPPSLPAPSRISVRMAGHPVPDDASAEAAREALRWAGEARAGDLVLVLLSGGGSALWTCPPSHVTVAEMQVLTRLLLASGAPIAALNTVRKAVSQIAGGRLGQAAAPARLATLVVSDVVGDDLATIASAPTLGLPPRRSEALAVLRDADVIADLPLVVRAVLEADDELEPATMPHGDTMLLGTNRLALEAARAEAEARGYAARIVTDSMEGEASAIGAANVRTLLSAAAGRPVCLLWGGETTVTLREKSGQGGRNQEVALAAALVGGGTARPFCYLAAGTDGIDGPTDAAGGWATRHTLADARALGLDARDHLVRHDAYPLLDATGHLVRTGPTHTNVADLHIGLIASGK